ncbi:nucleotidyltransferase family protein [Kribbella hippodromi]|uniref:Nucleotidyltransferase family protein n=1 Tax=Kribbella hippodromi TaxID=434347 RepID=A0ABN2C4W1_9ACTN
MEDSGAAVAGLVLAAGAGRRFGSPKALVSGPDGVPWVVRAARLLIASGCSPVVVVIGAAAEQVRRALTSEPVHIVEAKDWSAGMGASLRAGLTSLAASTPIDAVLVIPVDVPGLTKSAVRRVSANPSPTALARATYDGAPGHPVLIGREHWSGVIATAQGDEGARAYLRSHHPTPIDCTDLADGADVDTPDSLPPGHG